MATCDIKIGITEESKQQIERLTEISSRFVQSFKELELAMENANLALFEFKQICANLNLEFKSEEV